MHIEIKDTTVSERSGTSAQGRAYTLREQTAWVFVDTEPYPFKINLRLSSSVAYPLGVYRLADSSFGVGRYGDLEIDSRNLTLIADKIPSKL